MFPIIIIKYLFSSPIKWSFVIQIGLAKIDGRKNGIYCFIIEMQRKSMKMEVKKLDNELSTREKGTVSELYNIWFVDLILIFNIQFLTDFTTN